MHWANRLLNGEPITAEAIERAVKAMFSFEDKPDSFLLSSTAGLEVVMHPERFELLDVRLGAWGSWVATYRRRQDAK